MKQLLITIAAVVLVGCSKPPPPEISIHEAAMDGYIEAVKQHLAAGTDVDEKNEYGDTPLHSAVANDYKEIVELLIVEGADVNAKRIITSETPLDIATRRNKTEIATILRKHGGKTEKLSIHQAAKEGIIEAIRCHLATGTDVNALNEYGNTALDVAHSRVANLLRKHGAKTGEELKAEGK